MRLNILKQDVWGKFTRKCSKTMFFSPIPHPASRRQIDASMCDPFTGFLQWNANCLETLAGHSLHRESCNSSSLTHFWIGNGLAKQFFFHPKGTFVPALVGSNKTDALKQAISASSAAVRSEEEAGQFERYLLPCQNILKSHLYTFI